jgi:hypothetical protein
MRRTVWHITFGTYGKRMHGDEKPTVDRTNNRFGTAYLAPDLERERGERMSMNAPAVQFSMEQRLFLEARIPEICVRGGWRYVLCAAEVDHLHTLLGVDRAIHGKEARKWLKRWMTEALDTRWRAVKRTDGMSWFCEGGSTLAVHDSDYFRNAYQYILKQRVTPLVREGKFREIGGQGDDSGRVRPVSRSEGT